ncbi:zinc finger protein 567-like isoform X5 [Xenopus laevis]|uniref:Zinc finger protein 567-like isoform X5 n=1 Tax=Xenopus laevis TaxID=8355 RepID=A0A8J1MWP6_XENLA|nr:zinc finger protein 567-like isoform X5 [Xenopus laevis]XP_041445415.1 zinc finger protein 567-like isoform X5 [Xenopus laevis]XP_041445416.1 zinc finger protein 567-like isoform X5 [Xenopus laevis]XP_041445417.1 zinc finger protein 567-like isoform X5 [Xenopus laevis]XP_041445418.1 zinc finger protein 567-like isoform X5 [Xenopus laevis]XP_041445419.1 zinc finger protein 567-like isoform X5 [Xenopus laevis]XP_041445420.1 zinc finger protein 567-like isoform X5 [Xenopus laevis]XP_04144542
MHRQEGGTAYKCPYQGCTAVYRGSDDMKKHIKEHHEEVRERPCPHPGCNKVFMIDQYLQRHVKLIHTEERNHICDQCRQAFKQQKHLSVHQSIQEQASMPTVNRDTAVGRKGQALHLYPSGDSTLFPWIHSSWLSCTLQPTGLISSGTANLGTLLFCSLASRFIPGLQPQSYSISATINPVGDVLGMKLLKRTCWSNMDFFRCSLSGMRSIECGASRIRSPLKPTSPQPWCNALR